MRIGLLALAAALVCAACLTTGNPDAKEQAQGAFVPTRDCIRPLAETANLTIATTDQQDVARICSDAALAQSGVRAARARFYAGRALRAQGRLDDAVTQLRSALDTGGYFVTHPGPAGRDDFSREARAARFELSQTYMDQGAGSLSSAEELISHYENPDDVEIPYLRAQIALRRSPEGGKAAAFDQLTRVFRNPDLLDNPACQRNCPPIYLRLDAATVRAGRQQLFDLGAQLGSDLLEPRATETTQQRDDRVRRAVGYFQSSKDVVEAACPAAPNQPDRTACALSRPADAFYMYGVTQLEAAGVPEDHTVNFSLTDAPRDSGGLASPRDPGGLDCLEGDRRDDARIREAISAFDTMQRGWPAESRRASWGRACANLAGITTVQYANEQSRMIATAVADLRRALSSQPSTTPNAPFCDSVTVTAGTAPTIVTLARASVMNNEAGEARKCFKKAIDSGIFNPAQRSRLYLERARTFYFQPKQAGELITRTDSDPYLRMVDWVQSADDSALRSALDDLNAAASQSFRDTDLLALQAKNEAIVVRAHINMRFTQYGAVGPDLAPLARSSSRDAAAAAPAAYLLSRCLTLTQQDWIMVQAHAFPNDRSSPADRCGRLPSGTGGATSLAAAAYRVDPSRAEYRRQACITQLVFLRERSDTDRFCASDQERPTSGSQSATYAEAQFYEGMFWLRRALLLPERERHDAWSQALQNFRSAEANAPDQALTWEPSEQARRPSPTLSKLITYGQRYVQSAVGLQDQECAQDGEPDFFRRHGVPITHHC